MSLVSVGTGAKCINNVESVENWGENMKPNQTRPYQPVIQRLESGQYIQLYLVL